MRIALTGATGFIGRYMVEHFAQLGHDMRCWCRASSDRDGFDSIEQLEWIEGELSNGDSASELVADCDAVVHSALWRPGNRFMGGEGDVVEFVQKNVVGTLQLIQAARNANVKRFVFVSTCAVHDKILDDRPLDESHPLWAKSHYGAHKAAIEKFVHSFGLGQGFDICALRPTGVYGAARPIQNSKWYDLVRAVVAGKPVDCRGGGKEVHAADVAKAAGILLTADGIAGESFNCYDRYVSQFDVATMAKQMTGSKSEISGGPSEPKHQIETGKLRDKGMSFGGTELLRETIEQLIAASSDQD